LLHDAYKAISGKEQRLIIQLKEIFSVGEKCIVWSNFIENIDYFCKKFTMYNPCKIHGSMTIEDRNAAVEKFKMDPTCMVLFATPQAAKEGLTLTVANHVIFYDRGFNLDDYLQAQDRIHRISQKKTCYIYNFITRSSIDEWIDKLIQAKHYAALLAQGDIPKEEYAVAADYSYAEIVREILEAGEETQ
jgi:SNF2 family DNA or RNA helicase